MDNFKPSVVHYLKAGNPCLFIPTVEDETTLAWVIDAVREVEPNSNVVSFCVWKITTGLRYYSYNGFKSRKHSLLGGRELVIALQEVERSSNPLVAIFFHVRHFLDQPVVIQQIIDTVSSARANGSTIVFIGSHVELPPELHDIVTICEPPFPTVDSLYNLFKSIAKSCEDDIKDKRLKGKSLDAMIRRAAIAAMGLTSWSAENAFALSIASTGTISLPVIQRQKEQEIKKSDVLEYVLALDQIDSVGGFRELKKWLATRKVAFQKNARDVGLPWPKGILLCGLSGCGKSLIAKAVANFLELPLLRMDMGRVYRQYVGMSEASMRTALRVVEAVSPVVLQIDEMEKGLAGAQSSGVLDSGVTARVLATLLTWRQETSYPVFIIGTVNDPTSIPAMVYRKGRFDEIWAVGLPSRTIREEIVRIHLEKRNINISNIDVNAIVDSTEKFTGAEIESCIEDSMFSAFFDGKEVDTKYILDSIAKTNPQYKSLAEEEDNLTAWMKLRARPVD
jgi:AAA+ superfamily predicted ATPase